MLKVENCSSYLDRVTTILTHVELHADSTLPSIQRWLPAGFRCRCNTVCETECVNIDFRKSMNEIVTNQSQGRSWLLSPPL